MFHSRKMEQSINKIHKRALRLIYPSNSKLTFKELLDQNKIVSIHQENIQVLVTELLKAKLNISREILKELIAFFRCKTLSSQKPIDTERNKKIMCFFLGSHSFKNEMSLERFKNRIKTWTTDKCWYQICKVNISQLGFISAVLMPFTDLLS